MKIHSKQRNQPNSNIFWHQMCEIFIIIPLVTAKKCEISTLTLDHWNKMCWKKLLFQLWSRSNIMSSMYNVPRVKANADQCLQHHQGCPETPKSADVICERPLPISVKDNEKQDGRFLRPSVPISGQWIYLLLGIFYKERAVRGRSHITSALFGVSGHPWWCCKHLSAFALTLGTFTLMT